ncbi:MAG: hypothetical protein AB8B56_06880 [Crocinitomicaceae bacterium]
MKPLLICLVVTLTFLSCKKKDSSPVPDEMETEYPNSTIDCCPLDDTLDINGDGINDFIVEYEQVCTSDIPTSACSIRGKMSSMENVNCLYQPYDGSYGGFLFLSYTDTIHVDNAPPYQWSNYGSDIVTISWNINSGWDDSWRVRSSQNEYFLAFKLQNGVTDEFGYMELDIDTITGAIEIIDIVNSTSNFIVI